MGEWKHGGIFGFDKPAEALSFCTDSRGVIHCVARNGTELRHYMRGSMNPFPWESQGRIIPGAYVGCGHIEIWKDGNLMMIWPNPVGKNDTWWESPLEFQDPSSDDDEDDEDDPDPIDKKLHISGDKIYYGGKPIVLVGASCRVALWKGNPNYPDYDPWPDGWSLAKYEDAIIESGINYVRHLGTLDTEFLTAHCQRMEKHKIVVEIEVYDHALVIFHLWTLTEWGSLPKLGISYSESVTNS